MHGDKDLHELAVVHCDVCEYLIEELPNIHPLFAIPMEDSKVPFGVQSLVLSYFNLLLHVMYCDINISHACTRYIKFGKGPSQSIKGLTDGPWKKESGGIKRTSKGWFY